MKPKANTCTNDRSNAVGVCGECGSFLCEDCTNRFVDPAFRSFHPGGIQRLVAGVVLLAAVPFALYNFDIVGALYDAIWGHSVFLRKGLVQSSVILGVALLLGTWVRTGDSPGLITGNSHERLLCQSCYQNRRTAKLISRLVTVLAIVVIVWGVYTVATDGSRNPNGNLFFWELRRIAAGVGIYLLRDQITLVIEQLRR
ncbi:hypothetical protein SAMN05216226_10654 [Halovenus aranensis]|uniref:Uncharacterized protein n=1 Tax=Halovenus aranensis TaxID=890420 RepID=A0A1G8V7T3_9EURY|nr:hypothetical protein [Halovenus aranensis]SDJ62186.1 hypothetical protein SAMN05216226_10654 [Halovenus aranensis]